MSPGCVIWVATWLVIAGTREEEYLWRLEPVRAFKISKFYFMDLPGKS